MMISSIVRNIVMEKRLPGQLVVQITDKCNARCPQCGMRVTEKFPRSVLSQDEIRKIIDSAAEKGFQAISFTGGEPMLMADELAELILYAGQAGIPYIRTGTNGFFFAKSHESGFEKKISRIAEKLSQTSLRNFWISIDSTLPDVHEQMRGFPGLVSGIRKALPIFHEHGIWPSANLGINRNLTEKTMKTLPSDAKGYENFLCAFYENFREAFRSFYHFVADLGFTIVNSCYPMSFSASDSENLQAVYAAGSDDRVVNFPAAEKMLLFQALSDTIPEFRSQIRIFSPRTSLYALIRQYEKHCDKESLSLMEKHLRFSGKKLQENNGNQGGKKQVFSPYPCRGGLDFFYISAGDGNTYPCGYRGDENLGKFQDMKPAKNQSVCLRCDWECFRDPSELAGPVLQALSDPLGLMRKIRNDPQYLHVWIKDMAYYKACDFFDGRRPPDFTRLAKFKNL
ncbi:MAG: radical SAM protein [Desulfococcaceae bacterium]